MSHWLGREQPQTNSNISYSIDRQPLQSTHLEPPGKCASSLLNGRRQVSTKIVVGGGLSRAETVVPNRPFWPQSKNLFHLCRFLHIHMLFLPLLECRKTWAAGDQETRQAETLKLLEPKARPKAYQMVGDKRFGSSLKHLSEPRKTDKPLDRRDPGQKAGKLQISEDVVLKSCLLMYCLWGRVSLVWLICAGAHTLGTWRLFAL